MTHYTPPPVTRPLAILALLPALAAAADHIGAETCKACHPLAYEAWKEGPHARAPESLSEAQRKDARCTACHAPETEKGARGVTCETCHGGGRLYAHAYVMRDRELARAVGLVDPSEKTCLGCHTESTPSLTRFEYAKKLPLIEHGGDRAARHAAEARPGRE
jgi:cytochrome c554/c'-like protein